MTHTPEEIRELLLRMIVGTVGGDEARWRSVVGDIEELPLTLHPNRELANFAVLEQNDSAI